MNQGRLPLSPQMWQKLDEWCALWGCGDLAGRITVRTDQRLRTSLARASASKMEIHLHPEMAQVSPDLLYVVLCHELAHLAAGERYGRDCPPHGPEWKRLVEAAGHDATTSLGVLKGKLREGIQGPLEESTVSAPMASASGARGRGRTLLYDHTCPVCHYSRAARRPVKRWRCPECVEAGLAGDLQLYSVPVRRS